MNGNPSRPSTLALARLALIAALLAAALAAVPAQATRADPTCVLNSACTPEQLAKLLADDGAALDSLGISASLSGNTALVGARGDDDKGNASGSAYVFVRTGPPGDPRWTQQAKLLASDGAAGDDFGLSVALDGDIALVGARLDDDGERNAGSAYIFVRDSTGTWREQDKLLASDGGWGNEFGHPVSLSGSTALIGARRDDDHGWESGSAYVFVRGSGGWEEQAKLLASDGAEGDVFGAAVALSGDTALIGAVQDDDQGAGSGSAYVFVRDSYGSWEEQAKLLAGDGAAGDLFGGSVGLSDDTALVGAYGDDDLGDSSGSAYVFVRDHTGTWAQQAKILPDDGATSDVFGIFVALSGDRALFTSDDGGGTVYVFVRDPTGSWEQQTKLAPADGQPNALFGSSLALEGDTALIGANQDADRGTGAGSAYVFGCTAPEAVPITVHACTGFPPGIGQPGWMVRIYTSGTDAQIASGVTDAQGDVTFSLVDGLYQYTVEKNGSKSARRYIRVAGMGFAMSHSLSVLTVHVLRPGTTLREPDYTIRVYGTPDGSGPVLVQQDLDAAGEAVFVLADGSYSLTAEKGWFATDPAAFTLAYEQDLVQDIWGCHRTFLPLLESR
jgi:hypothetical protein